MKINKKLLITTILTWLIFALGMCSFIFSIGYIAKVADVWWQLCLGWCWLALSLFIPIGSACIINGYWY